MTHHEQGAPIVARPETAVGLPVCAFEPRRQSGSFNVNHALAFAADNTILAATTTVDHGSVDLP